ncbi:MAG: flagellar biosynthesis protein [Pseudomonadota bacterium]
MSRPVELETFEIGGKRAATEAPGIPPEAVEGARIEGYDQGYKTGWDDAMQKCEADGTRIGAEFERNLRDLGFTFEEARAHVLRSLEGLIGEIAETFLPALMAETIGPILLEAMQDLAGDAANAPVLIRVSPGESARLSALIDADQGMPFQIVDEPSLAEGQAYLKLGAEERQVDLSEPLTRIREAIRALGDVTERTLDERRAG